MEKPFPYMTQWGFCCKLSHSFWKTQE